MLLLATVQERLDKSNVTDEHVTFDVSTATPTGVVSNKLPVSGIADSV